MLKKITSVSTLVFFTACSSTPTPPNSMADFKPADKYFESVTLTATDRTPAQAPTLAWNSALTSMTVTARGVDRANVIVPVEQVMSWTEQQPFPDTRYEYRDVLVNTTCDTLICSAAKGNSPLWDQFFNSTRKDRAEILNEAIMGIGTKSAQDLISKGYFRAQPRTWDQFCNEIERAAKADVIRKSVATTIIYNNGVKNAENLGFGPTDCRIEKKTCSRYDSQLVAVPFTNFRTVEKKQVAMTRTFNVHFNVVNAKLLPDESEQINFHIDENGKVSVDDESGSYNSYKFSVETKGSDITINGTSQFRIKRDLSARAVIANDAFVMVNNNPQFVLDIRPQFIPTKDTDPSAQLTLDYTIQVCKYGWTGSCGLSSWKNFKTGSVPVTDARTVVSFKSPTDVPLHHKVQIVYTLTRRNSDYFNSVPTSSRDTESVKMPKK